MTSTVVVHLVLIHDHSPYNMTVLFSCEYAPGRYTHTVFVAHHFNFKGRIKPTGSKPFFLFIPHTVIVSESLYFFQLAAFSRARGLLWNWKSSNSLALLFWSLAFPLSGSGLWQGQTIDLPLLVGISGGGGGGGTEVSQGQVRPGRAGRQSGSWLAYIVTASQQAVLSYSTTVTLIKFKTKWLIIFSPSPGVCFLSS